MVMDLVSIPCGVIQYTDVGLKEFESRGMLEVSLSWGSLSQGSSSCDESILQMLRWRTIEVSLFKDVSTSCKAIAGDMMIVLFLGSDVGLEIV